MQLASPIFRHGAVVTADSANKEAPLDLVSLNAKQSRALGKLIIKNCDTYQAVFSDKTKTACGVTLEWEQVGCKVRLSPGVIIDFPRFSLAWTNDRGTFKIIARPTFTVCLNQSSSKIWLRYLLCSDEFCDDDLIHKFYSFVAGLNKILVHTALLHYKNDFSKFFGSDVRMRETYHLEILSGDIINAAGIIRESPELIFKAITRNRPKLWSLFGPSKLRARKSKQEYVCYDVEAGERGVFAHTVSSKEAILTGFYLYEQGPTDKQAKQDLSDENERVLDKFYWQSGALGLTAELCNLGLHPVWLTPA